MSRRKASLHRAAKMKVVYIAGPYTATKQTGKHINILAAKLVAQQVWLHGHAAVCPHLNTADFEEAGPTQEVPHHRWIEGDLAILARCDAVILLPNWELSLGATQEAMFAMSQKKPIFYWPNVEGLWVAAGKG